MRWDVILAGLLVALGLIANGLLGRYEPVTVGNTALVVDRASGALAGVCDWKIDGFTGKKHWGCGPVEAMPDYGPPTPAKVLTPEEEKAEMDKLLDQAEREAAEDAKAKALDPAAKPDDPSNNN